MGGRIIWISRYPFICQNTLHLSKLGKWNLCICLFNPSPSYLWLTRWGTHIVDFFATLTLVCNNDCHCFIEAHLTQDYSFLANIIVRITLSSMAAPAHKNITEWCGNLFPRGRKGLYSISSAIQLFKCVPIWPLAISFKSTNCVWQYSTCWLHDSMQCSCMLGEPRIYMTLWITYIFAIEGLWVDLWIRVRLIQRLAGVEPI